LRLSVNELAWFADLRGRGTSIPEGPLCHYRYRWIPKRQGAARLIESPKLRLKLLQRGILREILEAIPPHEAAHGFRSGRSVTTFVQPHVGRFMVLRLDLKDFFAGITAPRVLAVFLTAGYPEGVAQLLAGLCTHRTPGAVWRARPGGSRAPADADAARRFELPHLPQGAPTSPALANLAAYRLDCRLSGLARAAGATYTRYADDLVFSGDADFARGATRFLVQVGAIALEEGFEVNFRKTRIMRRGVSQRAGGLVLNTHPNIPRRTYDQLKAILYNCVKHGPAGQNHRRVPNFSAHLAGRVAQVQHVNPVRGLRLQRLLDRIVWGSPEHGTPGAEPSPAAA
jgi:RNA-directed DNA polymerase